MSDEAVERFRPTSGRILGLVALGLAAFVIAVGILDRSQGFPLPVVLAAVVFAILVWSSMLRPRVWATREHLVMRNMVDTAWVPLAAIEQVVVRQVLAVRAGERRYVSPAIGRSWRQTLKSNKSTATALDSYPVFVEERISKLADDARAQRGIARLSDEQVALAADVRRDWAWPEIVGLAVSGVAFVASLLW